MTIGDLMPFAVPAVLYAAIGHQWWLRLRLRNPRKPNHVLLLLAVFWPYCEMKADR